MSNSLRRLVRRLEGKVSLRYVALARQRKLRSARRRVFIDCGANTCQVLRSFIADFPDFEFFAFEPQPALQEHGAQVVRDYPNTSVTFSRKAVWIKDEPLHFFLATKWGGNYRGGSTLLQGHTENECRVDYSTPISVDGIDFSSWLRANFARQDYIIVKMDIEGAEYDVLEKMIQDDTLPLVNELKVEFHQHMNDEIAERRHRQLLEAVRRTTRLEPWR